MSAECVRLVIMPPSPFYKCQLYCAVCMFYLWCAWLMEYICKGSSVNNWGEPLASWHGEQWLTLGDKKLSWWIPPKKNKFIPAVLNMKLARLCWFNIQIQNFLYHFIYLFIFFFPYVPPYVITQSLSKSTSEMIFRRQSMAFITQLLLPTCEMTQRTVAFLEIHSRRCHKWTECSREQSYGEAQ